MSARRRAPLRLDVHLVNRAGRRGVPLRRSFEHWIRAALAGRHAGRAEVHVALLGAAAARELNRRFRGRDYATNVLSFPCEPGPGVPEGLLGDVVLCAPVVADEARRAARSPRAHWAHLTVHGVLHLLGHDHQADEDAARMQAIEIQVLEQLGFPDPYAEPAG